MKRKFITLLGGVAVGWPIAARAQQVERMRRIGVLLSQAENDPVAQSYVATFAARLRELGWTEENLLIDYRWGSGSTTRMPPLAARNSSCFNRMRFSRQRPFPPCSFGNTPSPYRSSSPR